MRRAKEMAAEAADKIKTHPNPDSIEFVVRAYFLEIKNSLKEEQRRRTSVEQVPQIFKEADDRWLGFCNRLEKNFPQIHLMREAFVKWSNGELGLQSLSHMKDTDTVSLLVPERANYCLRDGATGASYYYEDPPTNIDGYWVLDTPGWYQCATLDPSRTVLIGVKK